MNPVVRTILFGSSIRRFTDEPVFRGIGFINYSE